MWWYVATAACSTTPITHATRVQHALIVTWAIKTTKRHTWQTTKPLLAPVWHTAELIDGKRHKQTEYLPDVMYLLKNNIHNKGMNMRSPHHNKKQLGTQIAVAAIVESGSTVLNQLTQADAPAPILRRSWAFGKLKTFHLEPNNLTV